MENYEYAIALNGGDYSEPHRSGMTQEEAEKWMAEWMQMSGRRLPFEIIRRPVGEWEAVEPRSSRCGL